MAGETLFDFFKELPTAEDLRRWEEEHARMGATIRDLTQKREQLAKLIEVAAALHGGKEATRRGIAARETGKKRRDGRGTWMSAILEIVMQHPEGIAYDQIKASLPEPFASKIARDPNFKSFYGAMNKLEGANKAIRYRGHLFTPKALDDHHMRVARGEINDVEGHDRSGSPIDDEIKAFLAEHPRSAASAIRKHLTAFPDFSTSIKRNSSALYNVLRRLKDREEIVHHSDDGTYSLPNENEAPHGKTAGASIAEEVSASSDDTTPLFRVVK